MMVAAFALLLAAFLLNLAGLGRLALGCLLACLAIGTAIFLWEIYSPEHGFRMPWLQVDDRAGPSMTRPC